METNHKPASMLKGLTLNNGWVVVEQIKKKPEGTGGCFSVGYYVKNNKGHVAYLKALDFSSALNAPDSAEQLKNLTTAYIFERDLLERCKASRMSKVVIPLDSGEVDVPGFIDIAGKVYYIIFEMAKGDIRSFDEKWINFDLAFFLRSLHHTATGIKQLHSKNIAHQDLKPSNILVFDDFISKISDLGCASISNASSPRDQYVIPGDMSYAPPELLYQFKVFNDINDKFISDLYLLGSLLFYYFMKIPILRATLLHANCSEMGKNFLHDLPLWQDGFSRVLMDFEHEVKKHAGSLTDDILSIVKELCDPDPRQRNKGTNFGNAGPVHGLEKYVSRLDFLAKRAECKML